MCGLAGFNGPVGDKAKLKVLGVMNETRGVDSCGIAYKDYIEKGVEDTAKFRDLIVRTNLPPIKNGTVLIHTRHATIGVKSLDNAHPFLIPTPNGDTMVFAHNGTLTNWRELIVKYGHKVQDFSVDSQALGFLIAHHGIKILSEYEGAAACCYYFRSAPETLYLFSGGHRESSTTVKLVQERPLHYITIGKGLYFSSEANPLFAISNNDETVYTLTLNQVYTITNGEIKRRQEIDRNHIVEADKWEDPYFFKRTFPKHIEDKKQDIINSNEDKNKQFAIIKVDYSFGRLVTQETKEALNGIFYNHVQYNWITNKKIAADKYIPLYIYKGIVLQNEEIYKKTVIDNLSLGALVNSFADRIHRNYLYRKNKEAELLLNGEPFSGYYQVLGSEKVLVIEKGLIQDSFLTYEFKRKQKELGKENYVIHDLHSESPLMLAAGRVEENSEESEEDLFEEMDIEFENLMINVEDTIEELERFVSNNYFSHNELFPDDFLNTLNALEVVNRELQNYLPVWDSHDRRD